AYSPDGERMVTAALAHYIKSFLVNVISAGLSHTALDETARIWEVKTGEQVGVLSGVYMGFNSVAFSPDGSQLVTSSDDNIARLWDAKTGALRAAFKGHIGPVNTANFNPNGTRVVTA